MAKIFGLFFLALVGGSLILLLTGNRILVGERLINKGERIPEEDNRLIEEHDQAVLVCKYFTGRSVLPRILYYSSNGIMGADSCPFLFKAD